MTIRLLAINLRTRPGTTVGTVTLHDDSTDRTVMLRILDTDTPPGYRAVADQDDTARPDGDAFISEANRIMNVPVVRADEAAFRGFPLAHIKDEHVKRPFWRYIRGEASVDGLRAETARFGQDAPDGAARNAAAETVADSASLTADHTNREEEIP